MTREQMTQALEARARELGWETILVEDDGAQLQILVGAQGATEQIVGGSFAECRKELSVLGGPLDYPATEEYDLEQPQVAQEEAVNEAAGPEMVPETPKENTEMCIKKLREKLFGKTKEYSLLGKPSEFLGPDIGPSEDVSNAGKPVATQLTEASGGLSPKEIWQAQQGDTGPDGVPRPEQLVKALTKSKVVVITHGQRFLAPEGYCIKERKPNGGVVLYASILKGNKLNRQQRGSDFTLCPL